MSNIDDLQLQVFIIYKFLNAFQVFNILKCEIAAGFSGLTVVHHPEGMVRIAMSFWPCVGYQPDEQLDLPPIIQILIIL